MDARLEIVTKELNENLSTETVEIIDSFLADRPDYTVEKLKQDFAYLNAIVDKKGKVDPKDYFK